MVGNNFTIEANKKGIKKLQEKWKTTKITVVQWKKIV